MNAQALKETARTLYTAEAEKREIVRITRDYPELTVEDAYHIQEELVELKLIPRNLHIYRRRTQSALRHEPVQKTGSKSQKKLNMILLEVSTAHLDARSLTMMLLGLMKVFHLSPPTLITVSRYRMVSDSTVISGLETPMGMVFFS